MADIAKKHEVFENIQKSENRGSITYLTKGVCSKSISISVEAGIIKKVEFTGGCNGNLQGVSRLVQGMKVDEAIQRLKGIHCGLKDTSCPDQLANALESLKAEY